MPTVKIYVKGLNKQQKQELISLLEEAGYTVIVLEEDLELEEDAELEAPAVAPDGEEPSDEVLIVLITPASEAPDFKKAVTKAARRGHRVIGIWPKNETTGRVPTVLEDYGSSVIPWDLVKLRQAVREPEPQWETPAGTPRAQPVTKRHRC